ncbi:hypothetical protein ANTQUA_LOCUS6297 [Anthophora quadrimaculata]
MDEKFLMTLSPVYSVDVHTHRSLLIGGMVHDPPIGVGRRFSCECQPSGPKQSIRYFHNAQKFYNTYKCKYTSIIFCNKCIRILKWHENVYKALKTLDYCLSGETELLPANNSTPTLFSTI